MARKNKGARKRGGEGGESESATTLTMIGSLRYVFWIFAIACVAVRTTLTTTDSRTILTTVRKTLTTTTTTETTGTGTSTDSSVSTGSGGENNNVDTATNTNNNNNNDNNNNNNDTKNNMDWPAYQKYDWPGKPVEEVGHPLVKKGTVDFIENSHELILREYFEEFLKVYENRPDKVNLCGMRINHSYALFLAIKALKPTTIIENGVNAGHSTYIMRMAAGPQTKIYAIDPLEQPICQQGVRWKDTNPQSANNTIYLTGPTNFQDFAAVDWDSKIKANEIDPTKTLVLLDDHLDPSLRYPTIMKHGFKHVLLEDNYLAGKGATGGDKAGWLPKQLFHRKDRDSQFFFSVTANYREFPPLVGPAQTKLSSEPSKAAGGFLHATGSIETDLVAPLLRPDLNDNDKQLYESICQRLGIDPELKDKDSYMQVANYNQFAYLELLPMSHRLMQHWPTPKTR